MRRGDGAADPEAPKLKWWQVRQAEKAVGELAAPPPLRHTPRPEAVIRAMRAAHGL